jgi:hypothetical protein
VAAAEKAILLLIEEIERVHVLLWDLRLYGKRAVADLEQPEPPKPAGASDADVSTSSTAPFHS